jgi:hypothetical protein
MDLGIAVLAATLGLGPQSHYKDTDAIEWVVRVDRAEIASDGQGYRVYGPASEVRLILTTRNDSALPVRVDFDGLQRALRIVLRSGKKEVPIAAVWKTEARQNGDRPRLIVGPGRHVRIEPHGWIEWSVGLQAKRGKPFADADYQLLVDLARPDAAFFWLHGEPFGGRIERTTTLTLAIRAPASPAEVSRRILTEANYAMVQGRDHDAVAGFRELLAVDPENPEAQAGLGDAYLKLRMYRDAAEAYERIRPEALTDYNYISGSLALAYVALGDDASASRVLRSAGLSERDVKGMLTDLRQRAAAHRDNGRQ